MRNPVLVPAEAQRVPSCRCTSSEGAGGRQTCQRFADACRCTLPKEDPPRPNDKFFEHSPHATCHFHPVIDIHRHGKQKNTTGLNKTQRHTKFTGKIAFLLQKLHFLSVKYLWQNFPRKIFFL